MSLSLSVDEIVCCVLLSSISHTFCASLLYFFYTVLFCIRTVGVCLFVCFLNCLVLYAIVTVPPVRKRTITIIIIKMSYDEPRRSALSSV